MTHNSNSGGSNREDAAENRHDPQHDPHQYSIQINWRMKDWTIPAAEDQHENYPDDYIIPEMMPGTP